MTLKYIFKRSHSRRVCEKVTKISFYRNFFRTLVWQSEKSENVTAAKQIIEGWSERFLLVTKTVCVNKYSIDYEALEGEKAQKVVINRPQMREVGSS